MITTLNLPNKIVGLNIEPTKGITILKSLEKALVLGVFSEKNDIIDHNFFKSKRLF